MLIELCGATEQDAIVHDLLVVARTCDCAALVGARRHKSAVHTSFILIR